MKTIKDLHFQPWVGKNYGKGPDGKILLLGESHYSDDKADDESNFTTCVVKNHLYGDGGSPFFRKTGYAFNTNDWKLIWSQVAFANLIQDCLEGVKAQPNQEQKDSVNMSFPILLDSLKPGKVIVLSKRMWNDWLTGDRCEKVTALEENGYRSEIWQYKYPYGKCLVMGTYHPSNPKFSSSRYQPLIKEFLALEL
jgi:hypothetical protein